VNAKQAYSSAVDTRAETQRELTNLLNRKTSWTPDDLARFTYLYPSDHENEQRVQRTAEELSRAERESEEASADLGRLILSRYLIPYQTNSFFDLFGSFVLRMGVIVDTMRNRFGRIRFVGRRHGERSLLWVLMSYFS
jgi:hypothetical protein